MAESLDRVSEIFECSEAVEFAYTPVPDVDVLEFSNAYWRFKHKLGGTSEDRYWRRFLRPLAHYRFEILAAPLPFDSSALKVDRRLRTLRKSLSRLSQLYPQQVEDAEALVSRFEELAARSDAPLLSSITDSLRESAGQSAVLVVSESRLLAAVADHLSTDSSAEGLTVVSPSELIGHAPFAAMYLVGRMSWFPGWMIRAPRATQVTLVSYDGIKANESPGPLLGGEQQGRPIAPVELDDDRDEAKGGARGMDGEDLRDLHIRPELDLDAIEDRMRREADSPSDGSESDQIVTARPIELERDSVVFFKADDETTTWIVDLDDSGKDQVRRLSVEAVEPGMFILLRTEGGGDVLVPIADGLLGDEAERLRALQEEWKAALRDYVQTAGLRKTVRDLNEAGCSVANSINVKRWVSSSPHVIKTKKREHFEAILDTVGLGHASEDYWKAMVAIRDMHLRAGRVIRDRLLDAVAHADLEDLAGRGVVSFELANVDAGQLTAYRVRSVLDRTLRVPRGRLREVLHGSIV